MHKTAEVLKKMAVQIHCNNIVKGQRILHTNWDYTLHGGSQYLNSIQYWHTELALFIQSNFFYLSRFKFTAILMLCWYVKMAKLDVRFMRVFFKGEWFSLWWNGVLFAQVQISITIKHQTGMDVYYSHNSIFLRWLIWELQALLFHSV